MRAFTAVNTNGKKQKEKVLKSGDAITMRPHQKKVFKNYRDCRYVSIEQPPGSGKSALTQFIFADELNYNKKSKLIIAIPQNIISPNYARDVVLKYAKGKVNWRVKDTLNLCCSTNRNVTNKIIKFIESKPESDDIQDRVVICSHSALASAYKKNNDLNFTNTYVVVDESHHCMIAEDNDSDYAISNGLGNIVKYVVESNFPGSGLWMTTATFFRGDCYSVLPERIKDQFEVSFMPLDEHFNNLNIDSYSYDFVPYTGEYPKEELQKEFRDSLMKTIVYLPPSGRTWADKDKNKTVNIIEKIIRKEKPNARILDLVNVCDSPVKGSLNDGDRDDRKNFLMTQASEVDVVLAVQILDEGTDWVYAQKVLDLSPTKSLRIACQRFGRLLRDAPGKDDIYYKVFYQDTYMGSNIEEASEALDKYFSIKSLAFIQYDSIMPARTPNKSTGEGKTRSRKSYKRYFLDEVPDIDKRASVYSHIQKLVLKSIVEHKSNNTKLTRKEGISIIHKVLDKHSIKNHKADIAAEVEKQICLTSYPKFKGDSSITVKAIHWNKLADDTVGLFVSGEQRGEVWEQLRRVVSKIKLESRKTEQEHIDYMMENGINSLSLWKREHDLNCLYTKGYYGHPERVFNKSSKQLFGKVQEEIDKHTIELMNEFKLNSRAKWYKYYKKHNLKEKKHMYSLWIKYGMSETDFFQKYVGKVNKKSLQEHKELAKEHNMTTMFEWFEYIEENDLINKGYYKQPWVIFKTTINDLLGRIAKKTEQEHIKLIKDNDLISRYKYREYHKIYSLKDIGYYNCPWIRWDIDMKELCASA